MRKIEVVVPSDSFDVLHEVFRRTRLRPFRVSEIRVFDPTAPPEGWYRGLRYPAGRACLKLEWIVRDPEVEATLDAIRRGLDEFGQGEAEIAVQAVEDSIQVRPSVWQRSRAIG